VPLRRRAGRNRYIVFEIEGEGPFSLRNLIDAVGEGATEKGAEEMRLRIVLLEGRKGILRCSHLWKEEAIELLRSIETIGGKRVKVRTLGTSGTIRKAKRKYMSQSSDV